MPQSCLIQTLLTMTAALVNLKPTLGNRLALRNNYKAQVGVSACNVHLFGVVSSITAVGK